MLHTPRVFSPKSSFTGWRKLVIFLGVRPTDIVVPGQHAADAIKGCVDKWKKSDRSDLLQGRGDSLRWIDSLLDLPITLAIPVERVLEEL
jgi:hypothetical protein